jgi:hypothetical protein
MHSLRFFDTADGARFHLMHDTADDSRTVVDWQSNAVMRFSSSLIITAPSGDRIGDIVSKATHWVLRCGGAEHQLTELKNFDPEQLELAEVEAAKILLKQRAERGVTELTAEELQARQKALEGEIQANEDENRILQAELDRIYAEQDRRSEGAR